MLASKIFTFSSTLIGSTNLQPLSKKPAPPSISLSLRARVRCRQQQQQTPVPLFVTATPYTDQDDDVYVDNREDNEEEAEAELEEEEEQGIPGIQVPRQRYISIPKSKLLSAILSSFFPDDSQQQDFIRFSSCLDSILHAEHKTVLEEMRIDYNYSQSQSHSHSQSQPMNVEETVEDENSPRFDGYRLDLRSFLLGLSLDSNTKTPSPDDLSVAVASRFQSTFLKLLQDAEFEELSVRDLLLTSALNTDYLLTLPINIDWKRASESNAIIFRRGYATEKQKGLLIGEKLDYLQSRLLQGIFFSLSKPLGKVGMLIKEVIESASKRQGVQIWIETVKTRLNELFPQQSNSDDESACDNQLVPGQEPNGNLPIWLAAQKALPRYEGLLSSIGPRGRLLRKLLTWTGLIRSAPKTSLELDNHTTISDIYLRPSFLSRITLGDIWKPATREQCGNDFFKMLKTAVSILFSQSALQEPAFQELILLYNEKEGQRETKDETAVPFMKLKIYERIPIPDLPVVFPHKKLSFRILDTVRLDAASILGLLAFFVNYKFEDIRSSPSAVLLDVIAAIALIIYLTRLVLGYKQTWDRYQLLVNRTLYEKTLASGFGSVHFLLDASEQQQYKEAILAYAVLLGAKEGQVTSSKFIGDACEKFMYSNFKEKVKMPVDKAVNTLLRLGLVTRIPIDGNIKLQALPCSEGYEALKRHWDLLLV